jgi:RNA polymerase sigma-70 factor (ECF subfamily)
MDTFSAELADDRHDYVSETREALETCLQQLKVADRELITQHYTHETPIKSLAADLGRPLASVYRSLDRIRLALLRCIERRAAEDRK